MNHNEQSVLYLQIPEKRLSILLIHPALASEEMNQITLDHPNFGAAWRAEDAHYFTSETCKDKLAKNNIEIVNFKSPIVLNHLGA